MDFLMSRPRAICSASQVELPKSYMTSLPGTGDPCCKCMCGNGAVCQPFGISSTRMRIPGFLVFTKYLVQETVFQRHRFFGGHRLEGTGQLHRRVVGTCPAE